MLSNAFMKSSHLFQHLPRCFDVIELLEKLKCIIIDHMILKSGDCLRLLIEKNFGDCPIAIKLLLYNKSFRAFLQSLLASYQ